jgi:tripartite-type tricarboxylate transporter receptor subunit TctC
MKRRQLLLSSLASSVAMQPWLARAAGTADGFPSKPLTLVVPFLAGGATDLMARSLAQALSADIGQPIVVDNRAGVGGALGAQAVASAPKDGYTLLFSTMGVLTINPSLYRNLKYDPVASFAPIALTHVTSNLLVVNPQVPARSVAELVALAKSRPGELTFSSSGNGTSSHLSGEMFKMMSQVDIRHVPYKGTAAAMTDLLAGRISMTFDTTSNFVDYVKDGKLRALAVTATTRSSALPQVPTMSETPGFEKYDVSLWSGVLAPSGTPEPVVDMLNARLVAVMSRKPMEEYLAPFGITPLHSTAAEFAKTIDEDGRKWAKVVKVADVHLD